MPKTEVVIFRTEEGTAPVLDWLDELDSKVQDKCTAGIERLAEKGYELRRPEADYLRDKIYELRISRQGIHYRILYFFYGKQAVLSHGLTKESVVPQGEIDLAIRHKKQFDENPQKHTHEE